MPVCTWWVRPDRSRSMRVASCWPDGFPSVSPSMTTTVSAPKTKLPAGQEAATCRAFSRAARRANSSGGSPCWISSTIWLGWTSKSKPAWRNNSRRRGEAEARTKRMHRDYRRPASRVQEIFALDNAFALIEGQPPAAGDRKKAGSLHCTPRLWVGLIGSRVICLYPSALRSVCHRYR